MCFFLGVGLPRQPQPPQKPFWNVTPWFYLPAFSWYCRIPLPSIIMEVENGCIWQVTSGNYFFRGPIFHLHDYWRKGSPVLLLSFHRHREQVASTSYSSLRRKFMERKLALGNIFRSLGTYKHWHLRNRQRCVWFIRFFAVDTCTWCLLTFAPQEANISHLGKRKFIFRSALGKGYVSSQQGSTCPTNDS